jgi:hypothetical protein
MLLMGVTAFAVWLGYQMMIVHQRQQMLRQIEVACGPLIKPFNTFVIRNDSRPGYSIRVYYDNRLPKADTRLPKTEVTELPWYRTVLGDKPVPLICVPLTMNDGELAAVKRTFPEAYVTQFPKRPDEFWQNLLDRFNQGSASRPQ